MLDAGSLASLIRLSGAKVVIALGPTPGFSIAENVAAALAQLEAPPRLFTLHDPFAPAHAGDLLTAAAAHPGDRLAFERPTAQRTDIACYVHSGGTTGHPKIVKILHGGMVYRQWAANTCLAFTPDDVVLSDTPLFHIGGLLVRGLVSTADGHTTIVPSMHGARDKRYIANYWRYVRSSASPRSRACPPRCRCWPRTRRPPRTSPRCGPTSPPAPPPWRRPCRPASARSPAPARCRPTA
jgi:fatty-acyl-CoA synthase